MTDDIVDRLREYVATEGSIEWHFIMLDAADEIERVREQNTILFNAVRALTNGKSMYFTESLGRTVTMDAQNSWTELPGD